jgi:BirA family biotin operon repressor/biotin-[acetyl-CoA-carboxylase] ligase
MTEIKWPNDIMLGGKKAAGILIEADGKTVYIGAGINVFQKEFPPGLQDKATSIAQALGKRPGQDAAGPDRTGQDQAFCAIGLEAAAGQDSRFVLLEKFLAALHGELEAERPWQDRLEARLYMKGKPVRFAPGGPDSNLVVEGILKGIGPGGELLIAPADGSPTGGLTADGAPMDGGGVKSFSSGELRVYGTAAV